LKGRKIKIRHLDFSFVMIMGYLLVIISSLLFGILPSVQNKALLNGASPFVVLVVCNLVCLFGNSMICFFRKIHLNISRTELFLYLIAGIFGLYATDLFLNLAYTRLPVGMVTVIHFLYPILVCLEGILFYRDRWSRNLLFAVVLSVGGLLLLSGSVFNIDLIGIGFALISALAYSFNLTMADRSPIGKHDVFQKNFYLFLVSFLMSAAVSMIRKETVSFQMDQLPWLILGGIILMCGSLFLTKGIALLGSRDAAFISTLEPVSSFLFSTVIYHYSLNFRSILGCVLIILSLIPIMVKEKS